MAFLGRIFTPQTEYLLAQIKGIQNDMPEQERLAGAAIQESRDELKNANREFMRTLGEYGGSSTDAWNYLARMKEQQRQIEEGISLDVDQRKSDLERMRRQLALEVPIKQAQEIAGTVGDVAQAAAPFTGGAAPFVAAGGALLSGTEPSEAMTAAAQFQKEHPTWGIGGKKPSVAEEFANSYMNRQTTMRPPTPTTGDELEFYRKRWDNSQLGWG